MQFLDRGGQNVIFVYEDANKNKEIRKIAMVDKNPKNAEHLEEEFKAFDNLKNVTGLVKCFGMEKKSKTNIRDPDEVYLRLEYC